MWSTDSILKSNIKKDKLFLLYIAFVQLINPWICLRILQFYILFLYCCKSGRCSRCRWYRCRCGSFPLSFTGATAHTLRSRTARRWLLDCRSHNVCRACATYTAEVSDAGCRALNYCRDRGHRSHRDGRWRGLMIISRAPLGRHNCGAGYGSYDWRGRLQLRQCSLTIGRAALRLARSLLLIQWLGTEKYRVSNDYREFYEELQRVKLRSNFFQIKTNHLIHKHNW